MAQLLSGRSDILDELEGHLRDEVDELTRAGHPPEEAVEVAMDRLGRPDALAAEFAKLPAAPSPWLPVRVAWVGGALLAASMLPPLWPGLTAGGLTSLMAGHMAAVMVGYVATLLVGFLAACYFLVRPFRDLSDGQAATLRRAGLLLSGGAVALTAAGIAVGSLFCPHEKTGWAFGLSTHEVGGLAVLAWDAAMLAAFWRNRRSGRLATLMLLGVVGNVLVLLGWLGASAVERSLSGSPADYTLVVALVIGQAAIGLAALAPAGCLRAGRA
jgi:hypothetical protein